MERRAGLGVVTAAVLVGEMLSAAWRPPGAVLVGAPLVALLVWRLGGRRRPVLLWLAVGLAGFATGAARMDAVWAPELPAAHVAHLRLPLRTTLVGRIAASPEGRAGRVVLLVEAESIGDARARRPVTGRVRLTLRHPARRWRFGERLAATTILRAPRNFENPGRFDWVGHLARRGVHVVGSVWNAEDTHRLPARRHGVRAGLERWRARVGRAIARAVPPPEGAVLAALVIGDESGIAPSVRDAFTRAGVVHVLSVSGLHVGLVAAAAFGLARWSLARSTWLLLHTDVELVAGLASLAPVAVYAALAGLGVATLRSAIMVAAAVLAGLVGRRADVLRTLTLAALALALVWPGSPLDVAFQLSFASVLAIVWGTARVATGGPGRWRRLREALLVSPCALLGTAPLTAYYFHQVSLIGVIANPLAVPLFGSVVVGLGLAGALLQPIVPAAGRLLFQLAGLVLRPALGLVDRLAAPGWAAVDVPIPNVLELVLLYALLGALVSLPDSRARWALLIGGVVLLGDVGWWVHQRRGSAVLRVTFLDVGQGDAAVAELPDGRVIVIDAGGFLTGDFDTGEAIVGPFLWTRKIMHIDVLAMTHAHPDHSGGLSYLLGHQRPREFWWTGVPGSGIGWERLQRALTTSGTEAHVVGDGSRLGPRAAGIEVLHPPLAGGPRSLNETSLTLRLGLGAFRVLFTGDIEGGAESRLLRAPGRVGADVLKVPHHGSRTSSSPAFVDAVAPTVAVVSVGADNRYRLPSPEVEARYRERGVCLLRTDRCGAVTVETDGRTLRVETERPGCGCPGVSFIPARGSAPRPRWQSQQGPHSPLAALGRALRARRSDESLS